MRAATLRAVLAAAILVTGSVEARADDGPWPALTRQDLVAIHDILRDNHPGPVNPEDPQYRVRLDEGLKTGLAEARNDRDYFAYRRTLSAYINGFRDNHTSIDWNIQPSYIEWPGFLPGLWPDGSFRVGVSETSDAAAGEMLVSCDGVSAADLFERRVAPYRWNRDIASAKGLVAPFLLQLDAGDEAMRLTTCRLGSGASGHDVKLQWRRAYGGAGLDLRRKADGRTYPELGIRQIDGVWMISLPTFQYQSDADVKRFKAFLAEVAAHQAELRAADKVVIDVRGNVGGISSWGLEVAKVLWSPDAVVAAKAPFDVADVDWRASKANLEERETFLKWGLQNGLPKSAIEDVTQSRDAIAKALKEGRPFGRQSGSPAQAAHASVGPPPFRGKVYVFSDEVCGSSCLDFLDVILHLPGVVHVGRATSADAVYIDVNELPLPSGLGSVSYGMKVYRGRLRGNNESYTPRVTWPGGVMTDQAVADWIRSLP